MRSKDIPKEVYDLDKKYTGMHTFKFIKNWNGYKVYEPEEYIAEISYSYMPIYYLYTENGKVRIANEEETEAISSRKILKLW